MIIFFTFDTEEECDKFIFLYEHYLKTVYYTVKRFVNDPLTVEDLSQDVFIIISMNLEKCDITNLQRTRNYIITITRNLCKNHLRKQSKMVEESLDDLHAKNKDSSSVNILDLIVKKDFTEQLITEVRKLNPIYKDVLELKYIAQFSNDEIAHALNIEKKTVEMRLYRANKILRERLEDWDHEN